MPSDNENEFDAFGHSTAKLLLAWSCANLSGLAHSIANLVLLSARAGTHMSPCDTSAYRRADVSKLYQQSGVAGKTAVYAAIRQLLDSDILKMDGEFLAINPQYPSSVSECARAYMALAWQYFKRNGGPIHDAFDKVDRVGSVASVKPVEFIGKSIGIAGKLDSNARKPDNYSGKTDDFSAIPDNTSGKPDGNSGKPDSNAGKPDNNPGKPDDSSGKPGKISGKPDSISDKPNRNLRKPVRVSGKPESSGDPDGESEPRNRERAGADVALGTEAKGSTVFARDISKGASQTHTSKNTDDEAQKSRAEDPAFPVSVTAEVDMKTRSKLYASLCLRVSRLPDSKPFAELGNELMSLVGPDNTALDKAASALLAALQQNTLIKVLNLRGLLLYAIKNPRQFPIVSVQEVLARDQQTGPLHRADSRSTGPRKGIRKTPVNATVPAVIDAPHMDGESHGGAVADSVVTENRESASTGGGEPAETGNIKPKIELSSPGLESNREKGVHGSIFGQTPVDGPQLVSPASGVASVEAQLQSTAEDIPEQQCPPTEVGVDNAT